MIEMIIILYWFDLMSIYGVNKLLSIVKILLVSIKSNLVVIDYQLLLALIVIILQALPNQTKPNQTNTD